MIRRYLEERHSLPFAFSDLPFGSPHPLLQMKITTVKGISVGPPSPPSSFPDSPPPSSPPSMALLLLILGKAADTYSRETEEEWQTQQNSENERREKTKIIYH